MHLPVSIISDVITVIYSGESLSENPKLEIKINPVPKPENESMPYVYWKRQLTTENFKKSTFYNLGTIPTQKDQFKS